jgi:hypothetical protein
MGRNSCRQCQERLAAVLHSTSFKHALYWLMRNLLKIPRVTAGVNIPGSLRVTWLLVSGVEARSESCGIHISRKTSEMPRLSCKWAKQGLCVRLSFKERRMKIREPTKPHRNRGYGAPGVCGWGRRRRQTFDGASPPSSLTHVRWCEHWAPLKS